MTWGASPPALRQQPQHRPACSKGIGAVIDPTRKPVIRAGGYGENFATHRRTVWTIDLAHRHSTIEATSSCSRRQNIESSNVRIGANLQHLCSKHPVTVEVVLLPHAKPKTRDCCTTQATHQYCRRADVGLL